jgi:ketosteroid isomerase-like protein
MKIFLALSLTVLFPVAIHSQGSLTQLLRTEAGFLAAAEKEMKSAFLEYLAPDAVLFRPEAVNGREYWSTKPDVSTETLVRKNIFADISSNGMLGYTTGSWSLFKKGKSESNARFGQYVTIWVKKPEGGYQASVDIVITHEKLLFAQTDRVGRVKRISDPNKRGWSPADSSMDFLRMSMSGDRLGGAYKKYAADDIRLLVEREPPILSKKRAVAEMRSYIATDIPTQVTIFQAADMAYTWNPCKFANSDEGMDTGNCLNIWKLRNKKWWIVLGVYAKFPNEKPPELRRAAN